MWIVTNLGFLSVVAKNAAGKPSAPGPDGIVSIRFRRKPDAAKLFPNHERVDTPGGDYACRVFATRREVAEVISAIVLGMNYTNFKASIPHADKPLHDACMSAWTVFGRLQPGGPYGWTAAERENDLFTRAALAATPGSRRTEPDLSSNPFCDACGMRFGAGDLTDGLCADCHHRAMHTCAACGADVAEGVDEDGLCRDCIAESDGPWYVEPDGGDYVVRNEATDRLLMRRDGRPRRFTSWASAGKAAERENESERLEPRKETISN